MPFGAPAEARLSYGSYLAVDELTALQQLLSDPPRHDEMLFIIIHQVYELWFKELLHELDSVVARLRDDDPLEAQRLLRRCIEIERVLTAQVTVLETMTPNDFLTFRDHLMPASGLQSSQFRQIEFLCGVRRLGHLEHYAEGSPERRALERRLEQPTLGEEFYALLARRGFELPEGRDEASSRRRVEALARIYEEPSKHAELFHLAEALIELDEGFVLWRMRHIAMVERMIGSKPGTGGSEGVGYLQRTLASKFFPELWQLRTHLGASS